MEISTKVGKSGSKDIYLDAVQWGVARDKKNVLSFFAKVVKKVRDENEKVPETINVDKNYVSITKEGEVRRFVVGKDKKAKTISKSKPGKNIAARITARINEKYGHAKDNTPNR